MVKAGLLGFAVKEVADSESAVRDNDAKIDDYTARLGQIDGQLKQIETRGALLQKQVQADSTARRNEIDQLLRTIELDSFQLMRDGNIHSQYSGRVAEVMAAAGQVMPAGGRLLTIETDDGGSGLMSISYTFR